MVKSLGFSVNGKLMDVENQQPPRKNAWKLCGKMLPPWIAPRKRNNGTTRAEETKNLPINSGVAPEDFTKEDMWTGDVDQDYGEFYKKMNLNQRKVAKEAILFYNFFNLWRKLMFAITIVFFDEEFRLQVFIQLVACAVMILYIVGYWPCARFVDNVSKIVNEVSFAAILINCVYLKEMRSSVNEFDPSGSPAGQAKGVSYAMMGIVLGNMLYHSARLIHNAIQAAKTLKLRR